MGDVASDARDRFSTLRQAEEAFLARPLRHMPPIDFSRVSARERARQPQEGKEPHPMRLAAATATNPTPTGLDLTFRFRELTAEQSAAGAELVREVHAAAADGKITTDESTAILVAVVGIMNPVLAAKAKPLQAILASAMRDGKIDAMERFMIAFGIQAAFSK